MRYPDVPAEKLAQMESEMSGLLVVPQDAKSKVRKNKDTGAEEQHYYWRESAMIKEINVSEVVSNAGDEHDLYEILFTITGTSGASSNVGSNNAKIAARINPTVWSAGNKTDGQYKMSRGTIVLLASLVRATGIPVSGGLSSAQMASLFPENGGSPLLGEEILIDIHQHETDRAPSGWQCEVTRVFPLKRATADAEV